MTSRKPKHKKLSNSIDFLKIGHIAAVNLNMMFPVPDSAFKRTIIKQETNQFYKNLLNQELRFIKSNEVLIKTNAETIYSIVMNHPASKLAKRCNNFKTLEEACRKYKKNETAPETFKRNCFVDDKRDKIEEPVS